VKKSLVVLAISAASLTAVPAVASAKTLRLFSKPIPQVGGLFGPDGSPLSENQPPPVGSYFVGGDRLFKGTAKHHRKAVFGYDHIVCTIISGLNARCNANIVVRNGAIYATNFALNLAASDADITTGLFGTGRYRHVKSIHSHNIGNTDKSVLTIHY
jgi:hypothetical protein